MRTAIALLLCAVAVPAAAQSITPPYCGPRDYIVALVKRAFNEEPAAVGTIRGGALLELFLNEKGSWSVIVTQSGLTCIKASGEDWEQHRLPGRDS